MPDQKHRFSGPLKRPPEPAVLDNVTDKAAGESDDIVDGQSSNGSTGDQIGGQSPYSEDEMHGRSKGLPKE